MDHRNLRHRLAVWSGILGVAMVLAPMPEAGAAKYTTRERRKVKATKTPRKVIAKTLRRPSRRSPSVERSDNRLAQAAWAGDLGMVKALVEAGSWVNAQTIYGAPLDTAVRMGHIEIVEFLLANGAWIDGAGYRVPLVSALMNDQFEMADLLLSRGADIDKVDKHEKVPALNIAVERQQHAVLKDLLARGAKVRAGSLGVRRPVPLGQALRNGDLTSAKMLHDAGGRGERRTMIDAALSGMPEVVEWALAHGVSVHGTDGNHENALMAAADKGDAFVEVAKVLVAAGIRLNERSSWPHETAGYTRMTPIMVAASKGQLKFVEFLATQKGTKLTYRDRQGHWVLDWVIMGGQAGTIPTVLELLRREPSLVKTRGRSDPIGHAIFSRDLELVKVLVEHGASVAGRLPDVDFFLQHGDSDPRLKDIRAYLVSQGARPSSSDD